MKAQARFAIPVFTGIEVKGAYFAINRGISSEVIFGESGANNKIAKKTVKTVLKMFGEKRKFSVEIKGNCYEYIDSNSAVVVSSALATVGEIAEERGAIYEFKMDRFMRVQFSVIDGKVVDKLSILKECSKNTGINFSSVVSSAFGGFSVTEGYEIKRRGEMERFYVVFERAERFFNCDDSQLELCYEKALGGDIYGAMKLNAFLHGVNSGEPIFGVTEKGFKFILKKERPNREFFKTSNMEAKILKKPKGVVKIHEFLRIKRDENFYLI